MSVFEGRAAGVDLGLGPDRLSRFQGPSAGPGPVLTPFAPKSVNTDGGVGSALVTWEAPDAVLDAVTGYRLQWAQDSAGNVGGILGTSAVVPASSRSAVVPDNGTVLPEGSYWVRAQARNVHGWGDWSPWAAFFAESGLPTEAVPGPPSNVVAVPTSAGAVVTFSPSPAAYPPVTSYSWAAGGASGTITMPAPLTFTVTGQSAGSYTASVVANNSKGSSTAATGSYMVSATAQAPLPPTNVTASPTFDGGIVTWVASPSAGVIRYDLSVDNGLKTGSVVAGTSLRFQFTGLQPGLHSVTVKAVKPDVAPSAAASAAWYIVSENTAVIEYRLVSGDNRPGFQAAAASAGNQGKALRVVGNGTGQVNGPCVWPNALRDLRFDAGTGFKQFSNVQGTLLRLGNYGTQTWNVASGGGQHTDTLTLSSSDGINVGDWIYYTADLKFSHKDTHIGMLRKVVGKSGNTIQLDKAIHRDREGAAARVRKPTLAPPATLTGGIFEHNDPESKQYDLVVFLGCQDLNWSGGEIRHGGATGLKTGAGIGGTLDFFVWDMIDDPATQHYGYGVSGEGNRETTYRIKSTKVRHSWTTDQTNWMGQSHFDAGNWGAYTGYGEEEDAIVIFDVYDTWSTGANDHEGGWNIGYGGVIRDTGLWGPDAALKKDPTGLFIRSRHAYILPMGLDVINVNSHGGKKWFAAVTIAEPSRSWHPWSYSDAPELGPGRLRIGTQGVGGLNTTDALALKQAAKITNLEIYGPVDNGIDVEVSGSKVEGKLRIERAGTGIAGASGLQNASSATFVNCGTNMKG